MAYDLVAAVFPALAQSNKNAINAFRNRVIDRLTRPGNEAFECYQPWTDTSRVLLMATLPKTDTELKQAWAALYPLQTNHQPDLTVFTEAFAEMVRAHIVQRRRGQQNLSADFAGYLERRRAVGRFTGARQISEARQRQQIYPSGDDTQPTLYALFEHSQPPVTPRVETFPVVDWESPNEWATTLNGIRTAWPIPEMKDADLYSALTWAVEHRAGIYVIYVTAELPNNLSTESAASLWLREQPAFRALVTDAARRGLTFNPEVYGFLRDHMLRQHRDADGISQATPWRNPDAAAQQQSLRAALLAAPRDYDDKSNQRVIDLD